MKMTTDKADTGTRPEDSGKIVNGVRRKVAVLPEVSAEEAGVRPEDTANIVNGVGRTHIRTMPEVSAEEAGVRPEDTARIVHGIRGTLPSKAEGESRQVEADTNLSAVQTARGGAATDDPQPETE